QVVGNMREEGAPGLELLHQAQRVGHGGMRGVRAMTQSVKKQDIEPAQEFLGVQRDFAEIGEVGGRAETKTVNLGFAVNHYDRLKARAKQLQRSIEAFHLDPRDAPVFVIGVKDVAENALHGLRGFFLGVERDLAFALEADGAHIVQAQNVVGV